MKNYNIILDVDSYKASHYMQLPPNTTKIFSYIESRGGKYDKTVMFGLQYYLKTYLTTQITVEDVEEACQFFIAHGEPFNYEGWMHVVNEHKGFLPLKIRAVPEGTVISTSNVLATVENTCPHCAWVTSWVETMLLRIWYPITVATESYHIKKILKYYLDLTSDFPDEEIKFKLHDFGSRGVSSQESAGIGGAAHLVNFQGSDTVVGVLTANRYYKHDMSAFSIPASEHSTITSWGRDHEVDAYRNMITKFGSYGFPFAVVSDSYDIYNACENLWGTELKEEVDKCKGTLVIRPDSGDPVEVVTKCIQILDSKFGHTVNSKGYKVLNSVRIIQGDGINSTSIQQILDSITDLNYSATSVNFGMGGALLQHHNRDTQKFAMKCSYMECDGKGVIVKKDPVTDSGKRSKGGRLDLIKMFNDQIATVTIPFGKNGISEQDFLPNSILDTVYENGFITKEYTLDEIRERAKL